jgi:hypothetical protein
MPPTSRPATALLALSRAVAGFVVRRPVLVIVVMVTMTALLGGLSGQAVTVDAGAVENETAEVLEELDERFGGRQAVLQVVLTADRDVRSVAALAATIALREEIRSSKVAGTLADPRGHEPIVSFLDGAETAAERAGLDLAALTDAEVLDLAERAREQAPPDLRRLLDGLLASDQQPPTSGLILVFQDTAGLDDDAVVAQQRELAQVVRAAPLPAEVTALPFSMELLADQDLGAEIGQLFGLALLVILLVLAVVYWVRPDAGQRWRIGRRTAADVLLTLCVIVMAVVWMQGVGVLLGPGYLGLIGPFSPETDIVPILLVGLGVDFGIHLLARYRDELGAGGDPALAHRRTATTVGVALAVAAGATAIGFLTNTASPVNFLQNLGVLAAVGVAAAFVLTLTFLPAVRILLDRQANRRGRLPQAGLAAQPRRVLPRAAGRAAWLAERAPVPALAATLLLTVAGGYGFTQLDTRFALTDMVPQDAPELATFKQLETDFAGGIEETTQVLLVGDLTTPQARDALDASVARSAQLDAVELVQGEPEVQPDPDTVSVGRVTLLTSAGLAGALELATDLRNAFSPLRDLGVEVTPASIEIAQAELTETIGDSQAWSLSIALLAAMTLLVLYYWRVERRPLLGVVALAPAGIVLAWTFGTMALTGIPLNPVTATLAALSIGIAVPFTIHVTSRFVEERQQHEPVTALRRTVSRTGGALVGSALTTAIGFGVLITSTIVPFQQLGYIIVYVIAFSLAVSLLVLPSLLVLWDRWDRRAPRLRSPAHDLIGSRTT